MNLKEIVKQLESCKYECEGGSLENNVAFIELKQMSNTQNKLKEMYKPQEGILKPCPFCGSKKIVFVSYEHHVNNLRWKAMCLDCMTTIDPGWVQEKGYLKDMWNRRVVSKDENKEEN